MGGFRLREADRLLSQLSEQNRERVTGAPITRDETNPFIRGLRAFGNVVTRGAVDLAPTYSQGLRQVDPEGRAFNAADTVDFWGRAKQGETVPELTPEQKARLNDITPFNRQLLGTDRPEAILGLPANVLNQVFPTPQTVQLGRGGIGEVDPHGQVRTLREPTKTPEEILAEQTAQLSAVRRGAQAAPARDPNAPPEIGSYLDSNASVLALEQARQTGALDPSQEEQVRATIEQMGPEVYAAAADTPFMQQLEDAVFTGQYEKSTKRETQVISKLNGMLQSDLYGPGHQTMLREAIASQYSKQATNLQQMLEGRDQIRKLAEMETNPDARRGLFQTADNLDYGASAERAKVRAAERANSLLKPSDYKDILDRVTDNLTRIDKGLQVLADVARLNQYSTGTVGGFIRFGHETLALLGVDASDAQTQLQGVPAAELMRMEIDRKNFTVAAIRDIIGENIGRLSDQDQNRLKQLQAVSGTVLPSELHAIYRELTDMAIRDVEKDSQVWLGAPGAYSAQNEDALIERLLLQGYPEADIPDFVDRMKAFEARVIVPSIESRRLIEEERLGNLPK